MDTVGQMWALADVALAMVLGGLIGFEREAARKPAGFRTHMLVAGVSAVLVHLGEPLILRYAMATGETGLRPDPLRLFEAIVTGIAFLGAGTIIRRRGNGGVEGLTTAGSILMSAVIGICAALHQFVLAVGITVLTFLLLRALGVVERRLGFHREKDS